MSNVFLPASARTTLSWTASISGTGAFSVAGHALLWGAGYLYRLEGNDGPELWPLRPDRTRPLRTPAGELVYETTLASGERIPLSAEQVIPLRAISAACRRCGSHGARIAQMTPVQHQVQNFSAAPPSIRAASCLSWRRS